MVAGPSFRPFSGEAAHRPGSPCWTDAPRDAWLSSSARGLPSPRQGRRPGRRGPVRSAGLMRLATHGSPPRLGAAGRARHAPARVLRPSPRPSRRAAISRAFPKPARCHPPNPMPSFAGRQFKPSRVSRLVRTVTRTRRGKRARIWEKVRPRAGAQGANADAIRTLFTKFCRGAHVPTWCRHGAKSSEDNGQL